VLRPGGRLGVADIVADNRLTAAQRAERGDSVGCTAGALSTAEYQQGLTDAGFVDVQITPIHPVAVGLYSAARGPGEGLSGRGHLLAQRSHPCDVHPYRCLNRTP
jgi:arsenite methyltransferase